MISHVFKRAVEANIGEVIVAAEDQEIIEDVEKNGGNAILTGNNHKTGTDRIYEAFKKLNVNDVDLIMNLQGDEPNIDINDIINLNNFMKSSRTNIGTLASKIVDNKIFNNENVVKVITEVTLKDNNFPKALTFKRTISEIKNNIYHHLGIYCYSVEALERFVNLQQSESEIKNRLEQLRALDNQQTINVALANSSPIGVDTEEDYIAIKKIMEYK